MKKALKSFMVTLCMLAMAVTLMPSEAMANAAGIGRTEITCQKNTMECTKYGNTRYLLNSCTDTVAEFLEWKDGNPVYKVEISVVDPELTFADLEEGIYASSQQNEVLSIKYYKWYWYVDDPAAGIWRNDENTANYTINLVENDREEMHLQGTFEANFGECQRSGVFIGTKFKDGQFDFTVGEEYTEQSVGTAVTGDSAASASKGNTEPKNAPYANTSNMDISGTQKNQAGNNGTASSWDNSPTGGDTYACPRCGGTGNCKACGGSGTYYNSVEGKVKDCAVCKKDSGVCQTCKGSGKVTGSVYNRAIENDNAVKSKNDNLENQYKCSWCDGSGICHECNGSGKNNASSQVLKSMGCTLCDKSGKCAKCGGDGWASY